MMHILLSFALMLATFSAQAESRADRLFKRAVAATACEQVPNNGRRCNYKFGDILEFSVKDVGGTDTVILSRCRTLGTSCMRSCTSAV